MWIELLESRYHLTVTVSQHMVRITGTPRADVVSLKLFQKVLIVTDNGTVQRIAMPAVRTIVVETGAGDDVVTSDDGVTAAMTLLGGEGDDWLGGGGGADRIDGEGGADSMYGGAGDDTLLSGTYVFNLLNPLGSPPPDADVLDGGPGVDTADYSARIDSRYPASSPRLFLILDGVANDGLEMLGEFDNVITENVIGGGGGDLLWGDDGDNLLEGGIGYDVIYGNEGNDTLRGGFGGDWMFGGPGADDLSGQNSGLNLAWLVGLDSDVVWYLTSTADLNITLDGVANDGEAGEGDNVRPDNDMIICGTGNDSVVGSDRTDVIFGNNGDDTLRGGGNKDYLFGDRVFLEVSDDSPYAHGRGDDHLFGDEGDDQLYGGEGDDRLDGGAGADFLYGEAGNDLLLATDGVLDVLDGGDGESDRASRDDGLDDVINVEVVIAQ
jgi:Ca2+-binding RTX toxin-like protein